MIWMCYFQLTGHTSKYRWEQSLHSPFYQKHSANHIKNIFLFKYPGGKWSSFGERSTCNNLPVQRGLEQFTDLKYRAVGLLKCRLHTIRLASVLASFESCRKKPRPEYYTLGVLSHPEKPEQWISETDNFKFLMHTMQRKVLLSGIKKCSILSQNKQNYTTTQDVLKDPDPWWCQVGR